MHPLGGGRRGVGADRAVRLRPAADHAEHAAPRQNDIPSPLRESARALGPHAATEILRLIELPLASRAILAGIKTSAVLTVGTATIAAFIGAGGFGEPISIGLNLNDTPTILEGAIPAALLALLVQGAFVGIDWMVVPKGLRSATARETE